MSWFQPLADFSRNTQSLSDSGTTNMVLAQNSNLIRLTWQMLPCVQRLSLHSKSLSLPPIHNNKLSNWKYYTSTGKKSPSKVSHLSSLPSLWQTVPLLFVLPVAPAALPPSCAPLPAPAPSSSSLEPWLPPPASAGSVPSSHGGLARPQSCPPRWETLPGKTEKVSAHECYSYTCSKCWNKTDIDFPSSSRFSAPQWGLEP